MAPAKPAAGRPAADPAAEADAREARRSFQAGLAAAKRRDWSAAEGAFSVARERFRSAKMPNEAQTAADNATVAGNNRLRQSAARLNGTTGPAPKATPSNSGTHANKRSKEQCEQIERYIIDRQIEQMKSGKNSSAAAGRELAGARGQLRRECQ
ncbi:hypothetical protein XI04_20280 [Bradyrhizobium sp. CCBAU 11430]|nr:hypothetical protein [Bradyrhizobium sp. CCBAU 25360]MDA9456509.1 hypothetical protein [Bradyrhizobium sp. CCBAU 21359]MDA9515383.1 hypothetical protein [Bradyrhizobium sp. CCBAU 11430]